MAEKAEWAKLTPAAQKAIHRREQDFHRELTKQDPERNLGRDFIKAAQPYQQLIERTGKHPIAAFTDMMAIMQTMITGNPQQKLALLQQAAQRNGLDFRQVVGLPQPQGGARPAPGTPGATPPSPPQQAQLPPEILQWGREWNEFKATQSREAQERQQREQEGTMSEIMAFRAKPEARFFDQVRDTMIALLQTEAVQTLQEAYDQAIWARPDIRAILEQERTTAAQAQRDTAARAAAARRRGGSLRGSGGSSPAPAEGNRSLRQELEAGFAEARARI